MYCTVQKTTCVRQDLGRAQEAGVRNSILQAKSRLKYENWYVGSGV
jgi:hypothetical protein